jgi:hypothetical protein
MLGPAPIGGSNRGYALASHGGAESELFAIPGRARLRSMTRVIRLRSGYAVAADNAKGELMYIGGGLLVLILIIVLILLLT